MLTTVPTSFLAIPVEEKSSNMPPDHPLLQHLRFSNSSILGNCRLGEIPPKLGTITTLTKVIPRMGRSILTSTHSCYRRTCSFCQRICSFCRRTCSFCRRTCACCRGRGPTRRE